MIVDIHTHVPSHRTPVPEAERRINTAFRPDRPVDASVSWNDYLAAMAPVDRAVVFGIRFKDGIPQSDKGTSVRYAGHVNDETAAFVKAYSEKLIGFMSVHPEEPDALEEMERCVSDLGFKGMKLGPNYQGFDPLGAPAFRVYRRAEELGLPIVFHQGTCAVRPAPLRYAHPLVMDEIAIAFPELRVVMAHLGHPWQADTITVIRKHPHVYADISAQFYRSWSQYQALRLATEWNVLDKLVFGSDYPIATPQETMDGVLSVNQIADRAGLPPVPEDALRAIFTRDSLSLLGVEL